MCARAREGPKSQGISLASDCLYSGNTRKVPSVARRPSPEHLLQIQLIERVRLELVPRFPVLAGEGWPDSGALRLYAVPNGGLRTIQEGVRLKMEGVQKGVPDLVLPVARGGYHGLYLEMKAGAGRTSPEQNGWLAFLDDQGYRVAVAWSVERALHVLAEYLTSGEGSTPGGLPRLV